ncbi:MAG: DNA polymerase I [Firmicutes bacterium]|nr:DNA polymerase I [Bacillota bacterium]
MLIDGHSLLHRAFYALPTMTTSSGLPTNAVYGFATMLNRLLEDEQPDYVTVAFDCAAPTFRHDAFADYKATRPAMAEELRVQIPLVHELVEAYNLNSHLLEGYEADDIIGTLAFQAREAGCSVVIVTGDKDALQLVRAGIDVLITKRGITDMERFTPEVVLKTMGITPEQIPDWKALVGDKSDNIPGVAGIGAKTATRLLQEYPSLEDILATADTLPGRAGQALRNHRDTAILSKNLATIETQAPIAIDWEAAQFRPPHVDRLTDLFTRLEARSLLNQLHRRFGVEDPESDTPRQLSLEKMVEEKPQRVVRVDNGDWLEATSVLQDPICFFIVPAADNSLLFTVSDAAHFLWGISDTPSEFMAFVTSGRRLYTHDLKSQLTMVAEAGESIPEPADVQTIDDLMLASYLTDPAQDHSLAGMAELHGIEIPAVPSDASNTADTARIIQRHHHLLRTVHPSLLRTLADRQLDSLFRDVEMPLSVILAHMERAGIRVDRQRLAEMSKEMSAEIAQLTDAIYRAAGVEFNINSPKQLAEILFDRLQLPTIRSTKTGRSTSAEVLEELTDYHELPGLILDYRQLVKLTNTYIDALPTQIDERTGRIHTTFNQAITATGRLSSTHPNLQNIPIRTALGRQIRSCFVPEEGALLISADYSQIELRVLAHLSGDENLITAFLENVDIHTKTAAEVFEIPPESVTPEMRNAAKAINFGIVYGISSFGLARGTGLTRQQAQTYIDNYFKRYPRVKLHMEESVAMARTKGYVTTILGRRRYLPAIKSRRWHERSFAERTAMNTPIQGSAADIIKLAMIKVYSRLAAEGLQTRMLLQVHDELVFEAPRDEVEKAATIIREEMESAFPLRVPLAVAVEAGPNWLDTKEIRYA